jgi:hypothetical protein
MLIRKAHQALYIFVTVRSDTWNRLVEQTVSLLSDDLKILEVLKDRRAVL